MAATIFDYNLITEVFGKVLPAPAIGNKGTALNDSILMSLRVMDEQDHINKMRWMIPQIGFDNVLLERIMYYRGNAMMFYLKSNNKFYILPYVGEEIDVYGRYKYAVPLPFNGTAEGDKRQKPFITGKKFEVLYDIADPETLTESDLENKCVLLSDYSRQLSQKVVCRAKLSEPLLQVMSEIVPFCRTALINSTGILGYKIQNADDSASVYAASDAVTKAALNGRRWIPITGTINTEQLAGETPPRCQEYLLVMQSLDNLRLSMHGLSSGGLFQKKSHMLEAEENMNAGNASMIMQDNLTQRQRFCDIANSLWGIGIWCEASETVMDIDKDGDGEAIDEQNPKTGMNANAESGEI